MNKRVIYNVVHKNDDWHVVNGETRYCEGRFKSKTDAIERARDLAMHAEIAEVRVVKMDGSIQSEVTFGRDPQTVEG